MHHCRKTTKAPTVKAINHPAVAIRDTDMAQAGTHAAAFVTHMAAFVTDVAYSVTTRS